MRLCSPEGQPLPLSMKAVARPRSLEGLRIGLLDNTKAPVDKMMAHLGRRLQERIPGASTFYISKQHPALPAEHEVLEALRLEADVVINALGDWGSCTSWSVHDSIEVEKHGIPTVLLISTPFVALAKTQSRILGLPSLPTVVLPHPIGGSAIESVLAKLDAALDEIIAKLTTPLSSAELAHAPKPRPQEEWLDVPLSDEWDDLQVVFTDKGWSDGLPLVPPTEARVRAMLRGVDLPPDHVVGVVQPKGGVATVEKIAANAVMAGCRPEHLPVLIAAVEALVDRAFNLYGIQTTTHCVAPLLIVSGPLAQLLNVHSGNNLFGPGPWSNGVIGRAVRLILLNLGGGRPGEIDKATMGHPGKYTFCIAENEGASPWPSLRAERGFGEEVSTVTVVGGEAPHNINDHESTTAGGLITMIAGTMAQPGQNNVYYAGEPLLLLSPEHAATIAAEGYSKDDVKRALYEQARLPLAKFSAENIQRRMHRKFPQRYKDRPLDTGVTIAQRWEDMMIIVTGGPGKHSMYIPTFGGTRAVTRPILRAGSG